MAVDMAFLHRQTVGNERLAREVLQLFASQISGDIKALRFASSEERKEIIHRMVGAARSVGANAVADAAMNVGDGDIVHLIIRVEEACDFIQTQLANG